MEGQCKGLPTASFVVKAPTASPPQPRSALPPPDDLARRPAPLHPEARAGRLHPGRDVTTRGPLAGGDAPGGAHPGPAGQA